MTVDSLSITDFKNIASATLEFSPKINCFLGNNGMGKSNLLDALYLLSFCKSFTGLTDSQLIRRGEEFAIVAGRYTRRGQPEDLMAGLKPGRRKSFRRGGKEYKRLADHIGAFPLVMVAPGDISMATGEPAERRRLVDQLAAQRDPRYLDALSRYSEALEHRNKLLRAESADTALYEAIELQLDSAGTYICNRRAETVADLAPLFVAHHRSIAGSESPELLYHPALGVEKPEPGLIADTLAAKRQRDLILGYTASGPHRDDIDMLLDGAPVRRIASQGQTKTYAVALRFAQYELLRDSLGISPLLLLDDIFDKLDASRVERIISVVADPAAFGQIFITDTNRRHLDEIIAMLGLTQAPSRLWNVSEGAFTPIENA